MNIPARKPFTISSFGGLDRSKSRFTISPNRAMEISNYIWKDGVVQKREGFTELKEVKPVKYYDLITNEVKDNGVNFNAIWSFTAEDNMVHTVAHIGNLLFEVENIDTKPRITPIYEDRYLDNETNYIYRCYPLKDFKSGNASAFIGAKRLYILGGIKYLCLRFVKDENGNSKSIIYPIENRVNKNDTSENTYIPLTTIGITNVASGYGNRIPNEGVNLLSMWRKNSMITGLQMNKELPEEVITKFYEYELDAPIVCENEAKNMADFEVTISYKEVIR